MKRVKLILAILIAFTTISYGATYSLVSANYPILVNGSKLAVQPLNLNGTTYLPLRSISEAVGVPINWNGKAVEIETLDIEEMKELCVMIYADDGKTQVQGSAVAIDYDQYLTAYHVVDENRTNVKTSDGDILTIDEYDSVIDIATLKSTEKVKPVKIGDSDEVKVGDKVVVISAPKAKEDTATYATVIEFDPQGIVIKTTLGGGASGGAVFDMNGCLIGIIIAADGTTDAVETKQLITPINDIREAL